MTTDVQTVVKHVSLSITTGLDGAPTFKLSLLFNFEHGTVTGYGQITQAVNPPVNLPTRLQGVFFPITTLTVNDPISVSLTGVLRTQVPIELLPDVYLHMQLSADLTSGTASYRYQQDLSCPWVQVNNVPVHAQVLNG